MKTLKSILTIMVLTFLVSLSAIAQSGAKVVAVVNKADWCPVCKANGKRAMAAFMENNKDGSIVFVGNNVTNDQTKKKSAEALKKYGLAKIMEKYTATGVAYFFNPKTKALISQISIGKPDGKLAEELVVAKKSVK